ncbi:MAG: hypothetical protein IPN44_04955 [Flavobacteriales bacterium]|nr:hypothetical protein [Flavobacteriales bacterium]
MPTVASSGTTVSPPCASTIRINASMLPETYANRPSPPLLPQFTQIHHLGAQTMALFQQPQAVRMDSDGNT